MKKIGEILLDKKLITESDLEKALEEQKETKRLLGAILVEKGIISKKDLAEALNVQKKIGIISLGTLKIDSSVVKIIPERLSRRYLALAISKDGKTLKVAMAEPNDIIAIDTIRSITGYEVKSVRVKANEILTNIEKYYYGFTESEQTVIELAETNIEIEEDDEVRFQADDPPVIKYVNFLFLQAIEKRASDIHLEKREKETSLRLRIDGILQQGPHPSVSFYPGVVSRIKILSGLDIAERRLPQDGRCKIKIGEKIVDLRVSTFPTVFGEKIVIRILDRSNLIKDLKELDMSSEQLKKFQDSLKTPNGIILVTGPTGSGKTTTLYAALSSINNPQKNIVTIEDPVEYQLDGINQTQARPEIGFTFSRYLRHILRQDPDIIMIGEIRDIETAEIAARSALTGHLVLSTLHTNDAIATIIRLINMGLQPYLISTSLRLVIAQRLVRKLCPECKEKTISPSGFFDEKKEIYQPKGCSFCNSTGYWGRIGIYEVLEITPTLKNLIIKEADTETLEKEGRKEGMKTIYENGLSKVLQGITSLEEILSKVGAENESQ